MRTLLFTLLSTIAPIAEAATPTARELDAAIQRTTSGGYWGAALVVRDGETLLSRGYGDADYAGTPNTPDTLFEIASVSKQFTATAVLHLVQEGRLSLDTTLADLYPNRVGDYRDVTVEQLLSHTSGLDPLGGVPYDSEIERDAFIERALSRPPVSTPGQNYAYSNVGYALLAAIVESVTGQSFEDYAREHLFAAAGLDDTGFVNEPQLDRTRVATRLSLAPETSTSADWYYGWGYRGMGGVVTTLNDLARWSQALRTDTILTKRWRDELFQPRSTGYALGWEVGLAPGGRRAATHTGAVQGFVSILRHDLDQSHTVVLLSNGAENPYSILEELDDLLDPAEQSVLHVDVRDRQAGEFGNVELGTTFRWTATHADGLVTVALGDDNGSPVRVDMPIASAKEFAGYLREVIDFRGADGQETPQTESGVYLFAYDNAPRVEQGGVILDVTPEYQGRGENGELITDDRILITVVDEKRGFWPVMTHLNTKAAKALAQSLAEALAQK